MSGLIGGLFALSSDLPRRLSASARLLSVLFSPSFVGHANRGLLAEDAATEEAGASLATGTISGSASALAAMQPTNGARWPKEGRGWWKE
jgi:hypothetical protein